MWWTKTKKTLQNTLSSFVSNRKNDWDWWFDSVTCVTSRCLPLRSNFCSRSSSTFRTRVRNAPFQGSYTQAVHAFTGDFHCEFSPLEARDRVIYWRVGGLPITKIYKSTVSIVIYSITCLKWRKIAAKIASDLLRSVCLDAKQITKQQLREVSEIRTGHIQRTNIWRP